jgi:hypothetical protein
VNKEGLSQTKYGFREITKPADSLEFRSPDLGQRNPQHCPYPTEQISGFTARSQPLGEPLSIHDVAQLLGCSAWTVRQRYLPQGLPHLRACSGGRIVFFREQVIAWILKRQQHEKGGLRK